MTLGAHDTDRARRRLLWALGASALLHAWLAHHAPGFTGAPRVAVSGAPLTALLGAPPIDLLAPALEPPAQPLPTHPTSAPLRLAVSDHAITPKARAVAPLNAHANAHANAALPQASDPTYYGALSLDLYPKAIGNLDLSAHLAGATHAKGQVRATLLIDEAGTVNEVRAVWAAAPEIENAARVLLLQTRFTPARKDGRRVKAQLQISLDYAAIPTP